MYNGVLETTCIWMIHTDIENTYFARDVVSYLKTIEYNEYYIKSITTKQGISQSLLLISVESLVDIYVLSGLYYKSPDPSDHQWLCDMSTLVTRLDIDFTHTVSDYFISHLIAMRSFQWNNFDKQRQTHHSTKLKKGLLTHASR